MTDPSFEFFDPTSTLPDLQKTIGLAVAAVWIIFSTIAAPVIIQKVIISGALAGGEMLMGGARAAMQTVTASAGSAIAAAPLGPAAAITAGAVAGSSTLLSSSVGLGNTSPIVTGLAGWAIQKGDPSGSKAVQQMLARLVQRLDQQLPMIPPANLPPKI